MELTQREREVWSLKIGGMSTKSIAYILGISEGMVKHHVTSIFKKLHITNRVELDLDFNLELTEDFAL